jgi:hypothetical protein
MTGLLGRSPRLLAPLLAVTLLLSALAPVLRAQVDAGSPKPAAEAPREMNKAFVRDQTILGATIYGPAFATTLTDNGLSWSAAYLVMAGGSFFAAAELSRDITITEPMRRLATGAAAHGAIAGLLAGGVTKANARTTAAGVFFASIGGTALALTAGKHVTDDEVAGALFGADAGALYGFGLSRAANAGAGKDPDRASAIAALGGMFLGAPLGGAYVASVPYRVTAGDIGTLWPSAAIGATLGWATIANSSPDEKKQATALVAGSALGLLAADRWLVRRYDHTRSDANMVTLGAAAGGLMGAGVSVLVNSKQDGFRASTAVLTAAGMLGGVALAERFQTPLADAGRKLGRLEVNPAGILALGMRTPGTHSLLHWTF